MKTEILISPTSRGGFPWLKMLRVLILHWKRSHQLKATSCGMFPVSIRYRDRKGVHPWQIQYTRTYPHGSPAGPGTSGNCSAGYTTSTDALNVQRATARRALLHQQGEFVAATHQCEVAATQNLVSALARNGEAHHFCATTSSTARTGSKCAIFAKTEGTVISIFPRSNSS